MKKIFKKNQIIITALALMIAVAGYLQYTGTKINDKSAAKEASVDLSEDTYEISDEELYAAGDAFTDTEDNGEVADLTASAEGENGAMDLTASADPSLEPSTAEEIENPGEAVLTSSTVDNLNYAAEVKLTREQVRSKNKETLLELINNANISDGQKQDAINSMIYITDVSERELAAEMLLEAKGFTDVVVSITKETADVVLNMGDVTDAKRAQVEDIVKRKTNMEAESIVITPISVMHENSAAK
ncbi:SpoIIIAH-like family protein [Lachnospiraceae bacterium ZAX-1]